MEKSSWNTAYVISRRDLAQMLKSEYICQALRAEFDNEVPEKHFQEIVNKWVEDQDDEHFASLDDMIDSDIEQYYCQYKNYIDSFK